MAEYDSAIALAKRLIAKKGQDVTLRGFTAGATPDPTKPWKPGTNTPVNQTVKAVFLDYEQKYIDGAMIQTGDQKVYMPSSDTSEVAITPEEEGLVIRGAETWKIVRIKPLNPNGQSIMFELQVRQ